MDKDLERCKDKAIEKIKACKNWEDFSKTLAYLDTAAQISESIAPDIDEIVKTIFKNED